MSILSIQSLVAYGHAGNSAALFPLQRLGKVVWPIMTVHFSNHTGYGDWKGPLLAPAEVASVIDGVGDRGAFERCQAVLSGYQGAEEMGAVVLDAVAKVKAASPDAIYCCDPVMGDVGRGMFVLPGIPEFMRDQVVPAADVITPNHFELDFLAGVTTTTYDDLLAAVDIVRSTGPDTVLVTSVIVEDTPHDALDMVAVSGHGAWRTRFPRLETSPPGAGDLTTAVFLANLLDSRTLDETLARTSASVFAVVAATAEAGELEMRIVQAQDELVAPTRTFDAIMLR
ncbi:pyridoxal kinase [soil metagenome]